MGEILPIETIPLKEKEVEEMAIVEKDAYRIPFLDYETEIKEGEEVIIEDEAIPLGDYKKYTCTVKLPSGIRRKVSFNKTSMSNLVSAWGDDTTQWVGKKIKLTIETVINPKTKKEIPDTRVWKPVL